MKSNIENNATTILLEEFNPYQNIRASVESDGRTVYLYLNPECETPFLPRALWIKNLIEAPDEIDQESIRLGRAPLCKKSSCRNPDDLIPLVPDDLKLIWFQEGSGVALYVKNELNGFIPPCTEPTKFFGFARGLSAPHAGSLPLATDEPDFKKITQRISEDIEFWKGRKESDYWNHYRDLLIAYYENIFGKHTNYYAVVEKPYPPLGILEFKQQNHSIFATLGMSGQNMTPLKFEPSGNPLPRIEIICQTDIFYDWLPSALGKIATYPWVAYRPIGNGNLFESGVAEACFGFSNSTLVSENKTSTPDIDGVSVKFLEARLLTPEELKTFRVTTS